MTFVIILTIYYSLDSPYCFQSDNSTSACADYFCDKNVSRIVIFHLPSFAARRPTRQEWVTIFVCKKLYRGRKVYLYYIYIYILHVYFSIPKKTLSASDEQTQLFETSATFRCTLILIKRRKRKKRKKEIFSLQLFATHAILRTQNMNITKKSSPLYLVIILTDKKQPVIRRLLKYN